MISLKRRRLLLTLCVAAFACLAFAPALGNGFVNWDDPQLITENVLIRTLSPRIFSTYDPALYIPITLLTYQAEYALAGFHPILFHATNLLLHIAASIAVFHLLRRFLHRDSTAALAALLFAVHPLSTEAVVWVSARKDLLAAMFFLLSLCLWLTSEHAKPKPWVRVLCILLFVLAMLSKPTALVFPVVLLLLAWLHGTFRARSFFHATWVFWVFSLITGVIAVIGRPAMTQQTSLWEFLLLAPRSVVFSIGKFLLPLHLSAIYPAPSDLALTSAMELLSIGTVFLLLWLIWFCRRRIPGVSIGLGFFFITFAPTFFAFVKSNDLTLGADRYMYLPSFGLLLAGASFAEWALRHRRHHTIVAGVTVGIALACVPLAWAHTRVWQNSTTLFTHALNEYPHAHVALNNLGYEYMEEGNLTEAFSYFQKALAEKPDYADALLNVGVTLARNKQYDQAEIAFRKALSINPRQLQAQFDLAGIFFVRGDLPAAEQGYRDALVIDPSYSQALWQLAQTLLREKKLDEARTTYQKLLSIDPSYQGRNTGLDQLLQ